MFGLVEVSGGVLVTGVPVLKVKPALAPVSPNHEVPVASMWLGPPAFTRTGRKVPRFTTELAEKFGSMYSLR